MSVTYFRKYFDVFLIEEGKIRMICRLSLQHTPKQCEPCLVYYNAVKSLTILCNSSSDKQMKNNEDERRNSIGKKFRVKKTLFGVQKKFPNF